MKGKMSPLAIRKRRAVFSKPSPVKTKAAKRVDKLMKLYPRISTQYRNESNGVKSRNRILAVSPRKRWGTTRVSWTK